MKIITWNVYRKNKVFMDSLLILTNENFDVLCLQEVELSYIKAIINKLPNYKIYYCHQFFEKKDQNKSIRLVNLIISKHVAKNIKHINHKKTLMPLRYKFSYASLDLSFIYIDIEKCNKVYRVFNVHFECVTSPTTRLHRLEQVVENFGSDINIVAGDLNTFMNPFIAPLVSPLYGNFGISDYFTFERNRMNKALSNFGMKNVFKGVDTFKFMKGQYDYILLPKNLNYINAYRFNSLLGSDHYPLYLELE